jgi:hypothetical protein
MNLRSRLKKLENEVIGDDSDYCLCDGKQPKIEIRQAKTPYDAYATGEYVRYQDSAEAAQSDRETENEKPTAENCQRCGKPINKRLIILNFIG